MCHGETNPLKSFISTYFGGTTDSDPLQIGPLFTYLVRRNTFNRSRVARRGGLDLKTLVKNRTTSAK